MSFGEMSARLAESHTVRRAVAATMCALIVCIMRRQWLILVLMSSAGGGCIFVGGVPDGVEVLCRETADCLADQQCNVQRGVCVPASSDIDPPQLLRAEFSQPITARSSVTIVLTADQTPYDASVQFDGAALALSAATIAGPEVRFTAEVDDTTPEGTYALASVRLVDAAGNEGVFEVDGVELRVDRTPPTPLLVSLQSSGTPDLYADIAPHDVMTVTVQTDVDDVASLDVTVGGLRLGIDTGCATAADGGRFLCTVDLTSPSIPGGPTAVVVRAVDAAGNVADAPASVVFVDKAPPDIVTDAVQVEFASIGGVPVSAVAAGSRIVVRFVTSEPLSDLPSVVLFDGAQSAPFTFRDGVGTAYTYEYTVVDELMTGTHPILVTMSDVFGHTVTDLPLPLPAPFEAGVEVEPILLSACALPPTMPCADYDGDGFVSPGPGCDENVDCNDVDPTVYPGAHERPGDGVHNDCNTEGGDLPIDESSGFFVDKTTGDDDGPGTRDQPLFTIDEAVGRVESDPDRTFVYLAADQTFTYNAVFGSPAVNILGLDKEGWTRGGGPPLITAPPGQQIAFPQSTLVESVDIDTVDASVGMQGDTTFIDVGGFDNEFCGSRCLLIEPRNASIFLVDGAIELRIIGGSMRQLVLRAGKTSVVRSLITDDHITVDPQARLFGVNSTFQGVLECDSCAVLRLDHSAVRLPSDVTGAALRAVGGPIQLLGATLEQVQGCGLVDLADASATLTVEGSNLFGGDGPLVHVGAGACGGPDDVMNTAELNACGFAGCVQASDNVTLFPFLEPDNIHLASDSPLLNLGPAASASSSPAAIADLDGECRFEDGSPDIGPDERL